MHLLVKKHKITEILFFLRVSIFESWDHEHFPSTYFCQYGKHFQRLAIISSQNSLTLLKYGGNNRCAIYRLTFNPVRSIVIRNRYGRYSKVN